MQDSSHLTGIHNFFSGTTAAMPRVAVATAPEEGTLAVGRHGHQTPTI
jgi:hypothetical protein